MFPPKEMDVTLFRMVKTRFFVCGIYERCGVVTNLRKSSMITMGSPILTTGESNFLVYTSVLKTGVKSGLEYTRSLSIGLIL